VEPTPELIRQLVERLFKPPERAAALALLEQYGADASEPLRVHVALLKLCEGRLPQLEYYVGQAQEDYRDVLAWAEYPEELEQPTWRLPAAEVQRIREADRGQYLAWLRAHMSS
jgi:hypothetical protein